MAAKTRNISTLIESQLPGFINEDYSMFKTFIEKYYEQQELRGQPLDIISNITRYRNIDFYDANILKEKTNLVGSLSISATTINVEDATSFPEKNGYIKIDDEICFYKTRTNNQFLEVSRGVSGNNTLGDLYNKSEFVTTEAASHSMSSEVLNISNLFLYAFVRNFETEYLGSFPEKYLRGNIDKRTLIKNIADFYRAKGTDRSIKFLFNTIISKEKGEEVSVYAPKDNTLKSSVSDWVSSYTVKIKSLSGDPRKLVGNIITQGSVTAVVDNVVGSGTSWELILATDTLTGEFEVSTKTRLRKTLSITDVEGDKITVFSTQGFPQEGYLIIGNEKIYYNSKSINQFTISNRSPGVFNYAYDTSVYTSNTIVGTHSEGTVEFLIEGVIFNLLPDNGGYPYYSKGDKIQEKLSGGETNSPIIKSKRPLDFNQVRWYLNTSYSEVNSTHANVNTRLNNVLSDVSAIFEDDLYYYICSSSFPSNQELLTVETNSDLRDQEVLKLIRKSPITTTEVYETGTKDVGILVDGSLLYSVRSEEEVVYGQIEKITMRSKGRGYQVPPKVLINEVPDKARAILAGETVQSIISEDDSIYEGDPDIRITSGEDAKLSAIVTNGEVTSLRIDQSGKYYTSPPTIVITDITGKGNFAEYEAIVNTDGQIVDTVKVNGGKLYNSQFTTVIVLPAGTGASATSQVKRWKKNRYKGISSKVDVNNGYDVATKNGYGYGVAANPKVLRRRLLDSITAGYSETVVLSHSPVLGYAYDGNPIYGPYGYSDPLNNTSSIVRMQSGYVLNTSRPTGPSIITYPLGTFVDDYTWVPTNDSGKTELDENNGRFCITPEYPEGTYAYFITIEEDQTPVFPYTLGTNFYSLPVDSNYNSLISQRDLPKDVKRFDSSDYVTSGSGLVGFIDEVTKGSVDSARVVSSSNNFGVGSSIVTENKNVSGIVSSLKGKNVLSIESEQTKAIEIKINELAYLFAGDIISQVDSETGEIYTGEILLDVVNGNSIILRNLSNDFNQADPISASQTEPISASIIVEKYILDVRSTYSLGAIVQCIDIESETIIGTGEVLEGTNQQNTVIVRITSGEFLAGSGYYIKSTNLSDTSRSEIINISSLSQGLTIFDINDSIAILETDENHGVSVGDFIDVEIEPDDLSTETTYFVRKKLYQNIKTIPVKHNSVIVDTGIGSGDVITTGLSYVSGTYENVELIFQDSNQARTGIGRPGDPYNARATIVVGNPNGNGFGPVSSVTITSKGSNYRKEDRITFLEDDVIFNVDPQNTQRFAFIVDHVGFAETNEFLYLSNLINLSIGDFIKVGEEIVEIVSVSAATNSVKVVRGQKGTRSVNHYDGYPVVIEEAPFRFSEDYRPIAEGANQPYLNNYNYETGDAIISYDYADDPNLISRIQRNTVFFDESSPKKIVTLTSVDEVSYKLELSKDNEDNFVVNPNIDFLKLYSYKFDVSHISMLDTYLDISPSVNYNIITQSKETSTVSPGNPNAFLKIRFGFGPKINIDGQVTAEKLELLRYGSYYYFIKAFGVDTEGAAISVVNDPLTGRKKITYKTDKKLVYDLDNRVVYDGSGSISYTTTSSSADGSIDSISIFNGGKGLSSLPLLYGAYPKKNFQTTIEATLDPVTGSVVFVTATSVGSKYVNPKVFIEGDGSQAKIGLTNNSLGQVIPYIIDPGKGYSYINISVYEGSVNAYLESKTIGAPKTVSIILSGSGYTKDFTTTPKFQSPTILILEDVSGLELTTDIIQPASGASAQIVKGGWRPGSNVVKLQNVKGEFVVGEIVKSPIRNSSALVRSVYATDFIEEIKSYRLDGKYLSDKGKLNNSRQKIEDSYFYQDYSYVVESDTSIEDWRDLVLETTHPAGFQLFGETNVRSAGSVPMPAGQEKVIETYCELNLSIQQISSLNASRVITTTVSQFNDLNVYRGRGGISISDIDLSDTYVREIELSGTFDGILELDTFKRTGTTTFNIFEKGTTTPVVPVNDQQLVITLDGILQEPGVAYTVVGSTIVFSEAPLGQRVSEGQLVPAQKFYGKSFRYASNADNDRYLRKIENISDQFDNIKTDFDLYYTDGTIVKTDLQENLFVVIDGVRQIPFEAYTIERFEDPSIPDRIVFTQKPEVEDPLYVSNDPRENDVLRIDQKSFIYSLGNYFSATIDYETIKRAPSGPFLIKDKNNNKVVNVPDDLYALVFVDGVLQRPRKSYNIFGSFIKFTEDLPYYSKNDEFVYPKIEILYVYGKSTVSTLTIHDFEKEVYLRHVDVTTNGPIDGQNFSVWNGKFTKNDVSGLDYLYTVDADKDNPITFIKEKNLEVTSPFPAGTYAQLTFENLRFYSPVTQTFIVTSVANPGTPPPNYYTYIDGADRPTLNLSVGNTYRFDVSDPSNTYPFTFLDQFGSEADPNYFIQELFGTCGEPDSYIYLTIKEGAPLDDLMYMDLSDPGNQGVVTLTEGVVGQARTPFSATVIYNATALTKTAVLSRPSGYVIDWQPGDTFENPGSLLSTAGEVTTLSAVFDTITSYPIGTNERLLGKVENVTYDSVNETFKFELESRFNWVDEALVDQLLIYKKFVRNNGSKEFSYLLNGDYTLSSVEPSSDGRDLLLRKQTFWKFGSKSDESYYSKTKVFDNLHPDDEIIIAGETEYRKIIDISRLASKTDYRSGAEIAKSQFTNLTTSPYNGLQYGQQLSISAEIENGSVSKLNWNKTEFNAVFNERTFSSAIGYTDTPQVYFIPKTPVGGGAKAKVFFWKDQVWSIEITDGGSGYEVPPTVVVAKPYNVRKNPNRRIQSLSLLNFNLNVSASLTNITTLVNEAIIPEAFSLTAVINVGMTADAVVKDIITVIDFVPDEETVSFQVEDDVLPFLLVCSIGTREDEVESFVMERSEVFILTTLQPVLPLLSTFKEREINFQYQILTSEIFLTAGTSQSDTYAILDADFLIGDTVLYVSNTKGFPDSGRIQIEYETVSYEGREDDRFYISTRGDLGTLEDNHPSGSYVRFVPDLLTVAPIDIEQGIESFIYEYQVRAENTYRAITSTLQTINNASLISVDREFVSIISPVQEVLIVGVLVDGLDSDVTVIEIDDFVSVLSIETIDSGYTAGTQDSDREFVSILQKLNNASLISVDREFVSIISPVQEVLIVGILTEGLDSEIITVEEDDIVSVIDIEIITGGLQDSYRRITTFVEPEDQLITIDFGIRKFDRFDNLYVSDIDFEYQPKIQPYSNLGVSWQILRYLDVLERTDLNTANISTERVEVWIQPEDQQVAMSANTDTMVIVSIDYFDIQVGLEDIRAEFQSGGIIVVPGAIIPVEIEAFVIMPNITNVEVFIIPYALRFDDVIKAPLNIIKEWIRPFWDSNIGSPIFDNFGGSIVDSDFEIFFYRRLWTTFVELGDGRGSAGIQNFNIEITQIPISIDPEEEIIRFQQYLVTPLSVEQRWVRNWWDRDGELANASVANIEYLHQLTTIYDDLFEDVKLAGTDFSSDREIISVINPVDEVTVVDVTQDIISRIRFETIDGGSLDLQSDAKIWSSIYFRTEVEAGTGFFVDKEIISVINPVDEVTVVDVTQDIISRIRFETIGESLDLQSDAKIWSLVYFRTEAEAGTGFFVDKEIISVINPVDEVTVVDVTPDFINKVQLETIDGGSLNLQSDAKIWSSIYFRTEVEAGTGFFVDKEIVSVINPVQEVLIVGVSTEGLETSFVRIEQDFFGLIEIRTIDAGSLTPQTDLQIRNLLYFRSSRIATITDISFIYDEIRPIQISDEVAFEYSIVHNDRRYLTPEILVDFTVDVPIDKIKELRPLLTFDYNFDQKITSIINPVQEVIIAGVLVEGLESEIITVEEDDIVSVIIIETIDSGFTTGAQQVTFSYDRIIPVQNEFLIEFTEQKEIGRILQPQILGDSIVSITKEIFFSGSKNNGQELFIDFGPQTSVVQGEFEIFYYVNIWSGGATLRTGEEPVDERGFADLRLETPFVGSALSHEVEDFFRYIIPQVKYDQFNIFQEIIRQYPNQHLLPDGVTLDEEEGFYAESGMPEQAFPFEVFFTATIPGTENDDDDEDNVSQQIIDPRDAAIVSVEIDEFFRYIIPQISVDFTITQEITRYYPNFHLDAAGEPDANEGFYAEFDGNFGSINNIIAILEEIPEDPNFNPPIFSQVISTFDTSVNDVSIDDLNRIITNELDLRANIFSEEITNRFEPEPIVDALNVRLDTEDQRLNTIVELDDENYVVAQPAPTEEGTKVSLITSTGIVDSVADEFGNRYFRSTLGMTYRMFERNAFLSNGSLGVNASMSFTLDRLEVGEFEERDESSVSADGRTFNLAFPSINELATTLQVDLLTGDDTITTTTILDGPNSLYPTSGRLLIGSSGGTGVEEVSYTGISGNQFTGVTRGLQGSDKDHIVDPLDPTYVITIG